MIFDSYKYFESQGALLMQLNLQEQLVHHNYFILIMNSLILEVMDHYMVKQLLIEDLKFMIDFQDFYPLAHQTYLYFNFCFCSLLFNSNHPEMGSFNHMYQLGQHPSYLFFISLQILNAFLHLITNSFLPISSLEINFVYSYFDKLYCLLHFPPNKQWHNIHFSFYIRLSMIILFIECKVFYEI